MEDKKLKNMVILRNLPSNIVEEAIVILKNNNRVKNLEKIDNTKIKKGTKTEINSSDYMLKEAEMIVENYISKIENKDKKEFFNIKYNKKYIRLKNYAYITSFVVLIEAVLILFNL